MPIFIVHKTQYPVHEKPDKKRREVPGVRAAGNLPQSGNPKGKMYEQCFSMELKP